MLSIRLSRIGKKHQPSYRVIVCDKRKDPWGAYLENLGVYNPLARPKALALKAERIKHWISIGAQPTDTVWNLLVSQKIVAGPKRKKHKTKAASAEKTPAPDLDKGAAAQVKPPDADGADKKTQKNAPT